MLVSVPLAGWEAWWCYYPSIIKAQSHLTFLTPFSAFLHLSHTVIFAVCQISQPWHFVAILGIPTTESDNKPWQLSLIIQKISCSNICPGLIISLAFVSSICSLSCFCDCCPVVQGLTGGSGEGKGSEKCLKTYPASSCSDKLTQTRAVRWRSPPLSSPPTRTTAYHWLLWTGRWWNGKRVNITSF